MNADSRNISVLLSIRVPLRPLILRESHQVIALLASSQDQHRLGCKIGLGKRVVGGRPAIVEIDSTALDQPVGFSPGTAGAGLDQDLREPRTGRERASLQGRS